MKLPAILAMAILSTAAIAQDAIDNSPLYGTWMWTRPENRCTEVYDFRRDGVAYVVSGEERTENSYALSTSPGPAGRQRLVITTTKHHAGKDCAGHADDSTGKPNTSFVLFLPGRRQFILCGDEKSDNCFGPLFKLNP